MLEALERDNLFVVPLDDKRQWYRYHQLFADVLQARLRQVQPDLVRVVHERASTWYERHSQLDDAIRHALAAPNFRVHIEIASEDLAKPFRLVAQIRGMDAPRGLATALELHTGALDEDEAGVAQAPPAVELGFIVHLKELGNIKPGAPGYMQRIPPGEPDPEQIVASTDIPAEVNEVDIDAHENARRRRAEVGLEWVGLISGKPFIYYYPDGGLQIYARLELRFHNQRGEALIRGASVNWEAIKPDGTTYVVAELPLHSVNGADQTELLVRFTGPDVSVPYRLHFETLLKIDVGELPTDSRLVLRCNVLPNTAIVKESVARFHVATWTRGTMAEPVWVPRDLWGAGKDDVGFG
jgi:hypothetical protein